MLNEFFENGVSKVTVKKPRHEGLWKVQLYRDGQMSEFVSRRSLEEAMQLALEWCKV